MTKNKCQYLIKQISLIKELNLQYNAQLPLLPQSRDECLQLKNTISEMITDTKESIRIKWTNYEQLSRVELEPSIDKMEHVIITDDDRLISTSDNMIYIYDSETGKIKKQFCGSKEPITTITALNNDLFATGSQRTDGLIRIWNSDGKLIRKLKGHSYSKKYRSEISQIVLLSNNTFVSQGGGDDYKTLIVWDTNRWKEKNRLKSNFKDEFNISRKVFKLSSNKIAVICGEEMEFWDTDNNTVKTIDLTERNNGIRGKIIAIIPVSENKVEVLFNNEDNREGTSIILDIESEDTNNTNNLISSAVKEVFITSDGGLVNLCRTTSNSWLEFIDPVTGERAGEPFEKKVKFIKETKDHKIVTVDDERKITTWGDPEEEDDKK